MAAEFSTVTCKNCIAAVVEDGMKLHLAIRKYKLNLKGKTPKYQRFWRHVQKLKTQKELQKGLCGCFFLCVVLNDLYCW